MIKIVCDICGGETGEDQRRCPDPVDIGKGIIKNQPLSAMLNFDICPVCADVIRKAILKRQGF